MKKHLFWLVALTLSMAACTNEPAETPGVVDDNKGITDVAEVTQLVKLAVDNSRIATRVDAVEDAEVPGTWIEGPSHLNTGSADYTLEHVYSATGLAFDDATNTVYISWHSNRAQDLDEDSENHNHGTNVGENGSEPSLANADDWGGMVDVLSFPSVEGAAFAGSYWQPEHKYNHVYFADGYLYLASTSWYVGAALHRVPVSGTELSTSDAQRFNLTGNSANCVVKVDGKVVTVSGRTKGGVNWFDDAAIDEAFDAATDEGKHVYDLTSKSVNTETANFGGKHIWVDGSTVYVLRNPSAPVVETFTAEGASEFLSLGKDVKDEDITLTPVDGKNVLAGDDEYLYVCCGQFGLHVYSKSDKTEVAGSYKERAADNKNATLSSRYYAANGCDVDEKYVYVANGGGLVIFEKNFDNLNANSGMKVVKYIRLTTTDVDAEAVEKNVLESSNFVKVHTFGDKHYAFVAYGMYGLRIYDLSEFFAE